MLKRLVLCGWAALSFMAFETALSQEIVGNWFVVLSRDAFTDEDDSYIYTEAIESPTGTLMFACGRRPPEVIFSLFAGRYMGLESTTTVMYRVDGGETLRARWYLGEDTAYFSSASLPRFVTDFEDSTEVAMRVFGYRSEYHDFVFATTGFKEALARLGCDGSGAH